MREISVDSPCTSIFYLEIRLPIFRHFLCFHRTVRTFRREICEVRVYYIVFCFSRMKLWRCGEIFNIARRATVKHSEGVNRRLTENGVNSIKLNCSIFTLSGGNSLCVYAFCPCSINRLSKLSIEIREFDKIQLLQQEQDCTDPLATMSQVYGF